MSPPDSSTPQIAARSPSFKRSRQTRRSVIIIDRAADWTIRIGGLLVIVAVFGILAFLLQVVVPLFTGGAVTGRIEQAVGPTGSALAVTTDEYQTVVITLAPDGTAEARHIRTGQVIRVPSFDFGGRLATAAAFTPNWEHVAFGFGDGRVGFGRLALRYQTLNADQLPPDLRRLDARDLTDGEAVYSATAGDQYRKLSVSTAIETEQKIADGLAIEALDYHVGGTSERPIRTFAAVDSAGVVRLGSIESRANLLTRQVRNEVRATELPPLPAATQVVRVAVSEKADQVYVATPSGTVYRYDTRDFSAPQLAETVSLVESNRTLTTFGFLIGGQSLVVGDSAGGVNVWFRLARPDARSSDGFTMVRAHVLAPQEAAITAFSASQRGKMFATADARGEIWLRHATSEQTVLRLRSNAPGNGHRTVLLGPRDDSILAIDAAGTASLWTIEAPHPETTVKSIFGKIWYEGYDAPSYTWQSSSGTDSFEPKLSLVPLIFGTLKATFYTLLFAVPVALLAAAYTAEFVNPQVRATVKPVMEVMASLPSVVLGFIAAIILAPIVETWIAAVLMAFVAVPFGLWLAAHLWQLLPQTLALRLQGMPKFTLMFVVLFASLYVCYRFGGVFEDLIFSGDLKAWANGTVGRPTGFIFLMLLPLSFLLVVFSERTALGDWMSAIARRLDGPRAGAFAIIRWTVGLAAACLLSYVLAEIITWLGGDPRGGVVGTYVQRNTLIVGFAMAFAVIPIIYTISEDALTAVPEHLRAASLACGATPWQTATRVIVPTAISGIFAAVMIGMGRAVGETMIVVMAAGNTPILEWNVFNGLRALSANIAVELPEAVRDSTLYRTLFLAALALFVMTFVVNTIAEIVRQRFRKRAVQL